MHTFFSSVFFLSVGFVLSPLMYHCRVQDSSVYMYTYTCSLYFYVCKALRLTN